MICGKKKYSNNKKNKSESEKEKNNKYKNRRNKFLIDSIRLCLLVFFFFGYNKMATFKSRWITPARE